MGETTRNTTLFATSKGPGEIVIPVPKAALTSKGFVDRARGFQPGGWRSSLPGMTIEFAILLMEKLRVK
jgi:hypothetical protein